MRFGLILKLALVAAALAVVVLVAVVKSIDVNAYRPQLAAIAKQATGRDLDIKGRLSLKLSASPSLVAEAVTLANAPWGSRPEMMRIGRIEAQIGLLPLLAREIRVDRLVLVEPDILLEQDGKGGNNWQFPAGGAGAGIGRSAGLMGMRFDLSVVRIERGRVEWRRAGHPRAEIVDVQRLIFDAPTTGSAVGVSAQGSWNTRPFQASGVLGRVGDLLTPADAATKPYPVKLTLVLPSLVTVVDGTIVPAAPLARLALKIKADTASVAEAGRMFGLDLPSLGAGRISFLLDGPFDHPAMKTIDAAAGRKDQFSIYARGSVAEPLAGKGVNLLLGVETDTLAGIGRAMGWVLPAVGPVRLSGRLSERPDGWVLAEMKGQAGHSDVGGLAQWRGAGPRPNLTLKLASANVDGDEWQKAVAESPIRPPATFGGRVFSPEPLPWDLALLADIDLEWRVERLAHGAFAAEGSSVAATLNAGKGEVRVKSASFAGGGLMAKLGFDTTAIPPTLSLQAKADKVALGRVLDGMGATDAVSGARTDLRLSLAGTGVSLREIMASLDGETSLVVDEAIILRVDPNLLVVDLLHDLMPAVEERNTELRCLISRFAIEDGLAKSEALLFDTQRMTVAGQGSVNMATERLDLTLVPKAKEPGLLTLAVPIDIGGMLAQPVVTPDRGAVARGVVGAVGGIAVAPLGMLLGMIDWDGAGENPCLAATEQAKRALQRPKGPAPKTKGGS